MARLSTNPNDFCFADIPLTRVMQWAIEPTYLASAANNPQLCLKRRTEGGRMIAGLTHLALAATLAGAAGDQLFPWNKQKREFHAKTFAFAGIPSSPAIFGRRKQHHPSLGGELLLTLRQQTRNHHHPLEGRLTSWLYVRQSCEVNKWTKDVGVFPLCDEGNFVI